VSVPDVDSAALTTTLTVANGTLTVATAAARPSAATAPARDVSGSAARSTPRSPALSYRGNLNFNGSDTLHVSHLRRPR
jgi:hypothetical protein